MKSRWPLNRILIVVIVILATAGFTFKAVNFGSSSRVGDAIIIAVLGVVILSLAAILAELWSFQRHMEKAIRWMLAGNFDNKIKTIAGGKLAGLVDMINRLAEQLKDYDELRALRTGYANRAMYLLLNRLTTPAIIVDLPRRSGRANSPCQRALELASATISLDYVLREGANEEFAMVFAEAFEQVKRERKTACPLRLTPGSSQREVDATFIPIKGENEDVELGLILLTFRAQTPAARKANADSKNAPNTTNDSRTPAGQ